MRLEVVTKETTFDLESVTPETLPLLFLGMYQVQKLAALLLHILKHVLGVQELGIYLVRRQEALAHHKDFRRLIPGRLRFGRVNSVKELLEHPQQ